MEPSEVEDPDVLDEMLEDRDYLKASIEKLKADLAAIDNRLRLLGRGDHASRRGRVVSIRPPNRSFDVDRAAELAPDSVKIAAVGVS